MSRRFAAEAALVGAALLYGITFPLVHDALDDITPFAYLLGRFGIATLLLAPFAIPALRTPGPDRRMLVRAGLTAGVILFGGYATQTIGLQYTSPSTSAFITGLYVIITPVIESVISRRLPRPGLAGIVIATAGLYLLTGADISLGRGELFTLACAVLFAFHIVYIGAYANLLRTVAVHRAADRRGRASCRSRRRPSRGSARSARSRCSRSCSRVSRARRSRCRCSCGDSGASRRRGLR